MPSQWHWARMRRNFYNCCQYKQPDDNQKYAYHVPILSFEPILRVDLFSHLEIIKVKDDMFMKYLQLKKSIYESKKCTKMKGMIVLFWKLTPIAVKVSGAIAAFKWSINHFLSYLAAWKTWRNAGTKCYFQSRNRANKFKLKLCEMATYCNFEPMIWTCLQMSYGAHGRWGALTYISSSHWISSLTSHSRQHSNWQFSPIISCIAETMIKRFVHLQLLSPQKLD